MLIVSDLTKDIRPSLTELLIMSIHETLEQDKGRTIISGDLIKHENDTFYYRVITLFMKRSLMYYTNKEVEEWSRRELLRETILPKIDDMDNC